MSYFIHIANAIDLAFGLVPNLYKMIYSFHTGTEFLVYVMSKIMNFHISKKLLLLRRLHFFGIRNYSLFAVKVSFCSNIVCYFENTNKLFILTVFIISFIILQFKVLTVFYQLRFSESSSFPIRISLTIIARVPFCPAATKKIP